LKALLKVGKEETDKGGFGLGDLGEAGAKLDQFS
jgi:hypothetical protein